MKKYHITQLENGWTVTEVIEADGQKQVRKFIAETLEGALNQITVLNQPAPQQDNA